MNKLTQEKLKNLLYYNENTGVFTRASKTTGRCRSVGSVVGYVNKSHGYRCVNVCGNDYMAHRLAWFYMTGEWPKNYIDHIDRDRANNAFSNLREATNSENQQNQLRPGKANTSGFLGVSFHKRTKKWAANIMLNKKSKSLGYFDSPEDASVAYLAAKGKLHADFSPTHVRKL